MLEHLYSDPVNPKRVVVMGAGGFVGSAVTQNLRRYDISVVALTSREIDLLAGDAGRKLANIIQPDDALVAVSAIAPCKNNAMMVQNIAMMASLCDAIEMNPPLHVVYISSDAVYADSDEPLTEQSCAEPGSLHGAMHLAREVMLKEACRAPLAILRPSLIYGAADTHNGYGPNLFRRLAAEGKAMVLFGEGEERRDHVLIDDVAGIVRLTLVHRSSGILNVATGNVFSFSEVAEMVASHFRPEPAIMTVPRKGPMPHRGYRPFDISACCKAFPDFNYTSLPDGIAKAHRDMMEDNHG